MATWTQRAARVAAMGLALALTGCLTLHVRVADFYGDPQPGKAPIGTFSTEVKANHFIYGLLTPGSPEIQAIVAEEVAKLGGKSARNVVITHQRTFLDGLVGGCTLGIYTPTSVYVEGEVLN